MVRYVFWMALLLSVSGQVWGQAYQLLQTIKPDFSSDPDQTGSTSGPLFGHALAADGAWMIVGVPEFQSTQFHKPGMVEHYRWAGTSWQIAARQVLASGEFHEAECGHSVALAGSWQSGASATGCHFANNPSSLVANTGAVRLADSSGGGSTFFGNAEFSGLGRSVAIAEVSSGQTYAAVAAPSEQLVRIFRRNPGETVWSFNATVAPPTAAGGFGQSLELIEHPVDGALWLVVGAPYWSASQGKVLVFRSVDAAHQVWTPETELQAPGGQNFDEFGHSLAFLPSATTPVGDLIAVGAPARYPGGDSSTGDRRGTVSVYRQGATVGSFTLQGDVRYQCLFDPTGNCDQLDQAMRLGQAVRFDAQGTIWIGASDFTWNNELNVGRVYRARYTEPGTGVLFPGWRIFQHLAPEPAADDCGPGSSRLVIGSFGYSLAVVPHGIAVGFPWHGCQLAGRTGQVRIYTIPDGLFADRFE